MTVNDILNYDEVVKNLIDNSTLDGVTKFKFLQMAKQFEPIVADFNKVRDELITKLGSQLENGSVGIQQPVRDSFESDKAYEEAKKTYETQLKNFQESIEPVLNEEVSVDIKKFKAESIMNAGIPANALLVLYDLIEE